MEKQTEENKTPWQGSQHSRNDSGKLIFKSKTTELPQWRETCLCQEVGLLCSTQVMVPLEFLDTKLMWGPHTCEPFPLMGPQASQWGCEWWCGNTGVDAELELSPKEQRGAGSTSRGGHPTTLPLPWNISTSHCQQEHLTITSLFPLLGHVLRG